MNAWALAEKTHFSTGLLLPVPVPVPGPVPVLALLLVLVLVLVPVRLCQCQVRAPAPSAPRAPGDGRDCERRQLRVDVATSAGAAPAACTASRAFVISYILVHKKEFCPRVG